MGFLDGLKKEIISICEQAVIPVFSIFLPWKSCVKLYKCLCTNDGLYTNQVDTFYGQSVKQNAISESQKCFKSRARFHLLVDQADFYLTCFRGKRWFNKYVRIEGDPIDTDQGALFITFHWGQGFWALKYLNQKGYKAAWLHAPLQKGLIWGTCINSLVGKCRITQVGRLSGTAPIAVGNSVEKMRYRLVKQKCSVMAMPDAPIRPGASTIRVKLLGRDAQLPAGVIRMAASENIPVYAYTMIVNPEDGMRDLCVRGPIDYQDEASLAQALADVLTGAIEKDPSAWYVWPFADTFFETPKENSALG